MLKQFQSKQFFLFVLTGGFAAAVNFLSRIVYNWYVGFTLAVVLAYLTGMVVAFLLAKGFVFQNSQQSISKSSLGFVVVNIFAIVQTLLISLFLANFLLPNFQQLQYQHEIAHICGVIFPVFTSYLGHKYYSFK